MIDPRTDDSLLLGMMSPEVGPKNISPQLEDGRESGSHRVFEAADTVAEGRVDGISGKPPRVKYYKTSEGASPLGSGDLAFVVPRISSAHEVETHMNVVRDPFLRGSFVYKVLLMGMS